MLIFLMHKFTLFVNKEGGRLNLPPKYNPNIY